MKTGFIGTGNMGGAILKGYAMSEASVGNELYICNRTAERSSSTKQEVETTTDRQVTVCSSPAELAEKADIILIGVKPIGVPEILADIAPAKGKLIISMAAGVSIETMESALGQEGAAAKIIRIMPNTPAQVGQAMTSVSRNANVTDSDMAEAKAIFSSIGKCEEVPEDMIDCVIGVSGSSPAYTFMYIDALVQAAMDNGMEHDKARIFAAQAVLGAAQLVIDSDESLEQLRINVCSPNGTTIEAVETLFNNGFMDKVKEGFQAAVDRSKEMTGK